MYSQFFFKFLEYTYFQMNADNFFLDLMQVKLS